METPGRLRRRSSRVRILPRALGRAGRGRLPVTTAGASAAQRSRGEAAADAAALDLIGQHVGSASDVPAAVLREAVARLGLFLRNTEGSGGWGIGHTQAELSEDFKVSYMSESHGAALRRHGIARAVGATRRGADLTVWPFRRREVRAS